MSRVTTALDITGAALLTGAAYVAFGLAAGMAVLGGFLLGLSFVLTRGGR